MNAHCAACRKSAGVFGLRLVTMSSIRKLAVLLHASVAPGTAQSQPAPNGVYMIWNHGMALEAGVHAAVLMVAPNDNQVIFKAVCGLH